MVSSVTLEWNNLSVTIEKSGFDYLKCRNISDNIDIIRNATGHVQSGELTAVIGSSGSGKTTLLAAISKRFRGHVTGEIFFNGKPTNTDEMTKISCFVPQFDITVDSLTPREHLYFMGELKFNRRWTKARKNERIERLLWKLGLNRVANNKISSLSGGERKKLNLATDLLTDPPIIFCDEPTTGLDSFSALNVINTLKFLTKSEEASKEMFESHLPVSSDFIPSNEQQSLNKGDELEMVQQQSYRGYCRKAVMCSIHQPNSELFRCFSHIILMHSGECIFEGSATEAETFFSSLGFRCPPLYNPAEYYVKVISGGINSVSNNAIERIKDAELKREKKSMTHGFYEPEEIERNITWIYQVVILIQRSTLAARRDYARHLTHLFILMVPFITTALIYTRVSVKEPSFVQNIQGALANVVSQVIFSTAYGVIFVYPSLLPILRRETGENVYKFSAYYTSKLLFELPRVLFISILALAIPYFSTVLFKGFWVYVQMVIALTIGAMTANSYGFMLSGFFKGTMICDAAAPFDLLFLAFAGYYLNLNYFPYSYLKYISLFFFTNEALSTLYWHDIDYIECPPEFNNSCYRNGTEVLEKFSYNTDVSYVFYDYIGLILQAIVMHLIAFVCIRRIIRITGYY